MFFMAIGTRRSELIVTDLAYIVLSSLPRNHETLVSASSLLLRMEADGIPIERAAPLLVAIDPFDPEQTASRLRSALGSGDRERISAAMEGVYLWTVQASRGQLPDVPQDLIREIGATVRMRRPPALDTALVFSARLLGHLPKGMREQLIEDVRIGLEYLAQELKYRNAIDYSGPVPYEDVPSYRALSAQVAEELKHWISSDRPVVQLWSQLMKEEPLAYVRRVAGKL